MKLCLKIAEDHAKLSCQGISNPILSYNSVDLERVLNDGMREFVCRTGRIILQYTFNIYK